ncbi:MULTISPECIES: succinate dehydrogenase cytochrome b subunit [Mumia]|uniref:succinate dehydrogenase cytochrome b subunit n=1 Tax=Mumia TaxID=1546255 RepID=UPI001421EE24|nr:succinate dehydrogenase cytochrome b subunit [Mumia sp. ZJ1417]QMW65646.1 succinate dehydrogenase cytochrome b subunit [Mumia sp. ZJ1417]
MATTEMTKQRMGARRSTVALKALMAVSGLIMVGYLLLHMYGNLKVFSGQAAFDGYSHHLRILGEPYLPREGALWIIRVVLLVAIIGHVYAAVVLSRRDHKAIKVGSGPRYKSKQNKRGFQRSYASFTLRWGGVIILLFIIFHLLNLTTNDIAPGGASPSPYERVLNTFGEWYMVLAYTIALLAVGFHLRHGVWSALTTLGANTSVKARRNLNVLAYAVAGIITIGFLVPPFAIFFGWVG